MRGLAASTGLNHAGTATSFAAHSTIIGSAARADDRRSLLIHSDTGYVASRPRRNRPGSVFFRRTSPTTTHEPISRHAGSKTPWPPTKHLQALATDLPTRHALGGVAETLLDALSASADPDGALVGFTRYLATRTPRRSFLGYLADDPRAVQILTQLLGASPALGEILVRNPEYFHWLQLSLNRTPARPR